MARKSINTYVRFKGPFSKDTKEELLGVDLAEFLFEKLRQRGLSVRPVKKTEIPPTVNVTSGSIEYRLIVCPSIYDPSYWEIDCPRTIGFIGRLFGKSEEDELGTLVNAIAEILRDEEVITHVKWYSDYSEHLDENSRAHSLKYLRIFGKFLSKLIPWLCVGGFALVVIGFAIERKKGLLCNIGATIFVVGFCSFFLFTGISYSLQSILKIKNTLLRKGVKKNMWMISFLFAILVLGVGFVIFGLFFSRLVIGIWK